MLKFELSKNARHTFKCHFSVCFDQRDARRAAVSLHIVKGSSNGRRMPKPCPCVILADN